MAGSIVEIMRREVDAVARRLSAMVFRGVIASAEGVVARLNGMGETFDGAEVFYPYGLVARPVQGTQAVCLRIGARGAHTIVVACRDKRLEDAAGTLQPGEVALVAGGGAKLLLKTNGEVVINGGTKGIARTDDEIQILATEIASKLSVPITGPAGTTAVAASGTVVGKVAGGSSTVKAG